MEPQHYETFKEALDNVVKKLADNANDLEVLKKHKGFNRLDHADQAMFETLSCVVRNTLFSLESYRESRLYFLSQENNKNVIAVNFKKSG